MPHTNHFLCLEILKIAQREVETNKTIKRFGSFINVSQIKTNEEHVKQTIT
jgi:hypothetical protein